MNTMLILLLLLTLTLTITPAARAAEHRAESPSERTFTDAERAHWAFQTVRRELPPEVSHREWARNPIDAFVLRKLEKKGIPPGPEADRITLIRRVSLDLIGLPPTPDEVHAFLNDSDPEAFERVVDRLLHSPHYGERWARHWLDLARFAESAGFEQDETRPNAWRYRDYVIDAFNGDKPYDRFVREQIAGDELWPDEFPARIATAFLRHYPEEGNNKDLLLARQDILHHVTDVVGATFLGLTFNCAQCHDHKYDPILQKDYYRLQAFFANIGHDDRIPLVNADQLREHEKQLTAYEQRTRALWDEMDSLLAMVRQYSPDQLLARYPDYVIAASKTPAEQRTPIQAQIAYLLDHKDCNTCPIKPPPYRDPSFAKEAGKLAGAAKQRFAEIKAELDALAPQIPQDIPRTMGIIDTSAQAPSTYVLGVGLYTSPQEEVQPGFLSILDPSPAVVPPPQGRPSTGRRSALANWLASPSNPLTARVMVNRLWQSHFGKGIVGTSSDFGVVGDPPTHPELLDWLADEFIQGGWSIKRMHRLMMTSSTYRQSSLDRPDARQIDPGNLALWRFPPRRLDAESIRDTALSVAGRINPNVGGPSVFPPLPAGRPTPTGGWKVSPQASDHLRRSIYIFVRRNDRYPILELFDFPDSHESCPRRQQTTTATQALTLMNGELSSAWARAFAERVIQQAGDELPNQIATACELAYSRPPDPWESRAALAFFQRHTEVIRQDRGDMAAAEEARAELTDSAIRLAVLTDYCLMLLNSNEFVFQF